jgi:hypothetical protein
MARAIIRYSFDGEEGKAIRHEIGKRLLSSGRFARHGTASWKARQTRRSPTQSVISGGRSNTFRSTPMRWTTSGSTSMTPGQLQADQLSTTRVAAGGSTNVCSRSNLGSNLRDTGGDPARENPVNTGLYHSDILHLVGWGPGGRRFKSCLPDRFRRSSTAQPIFAKPDRALRERGLGARSRQRTGREPPGSLQANGAAFPPADRQLRGAVAGAVVSLSSSA